MRALIVAALCLGACAHVSVENSDAKWDCAIVAYAMTGDSMVPVDQLNPAQCQMFPPQEMRPIVHLTHCRLEDVVITCAPSIHAEAEELRRMHVTVKRR